MQKVVENYILYETVGAGQYGKVYRAKNSKTNETVAIKVVPLEKFNQVPKLEEFTSNEIKTLARINNINVVKFIEMLKTANNMYLVYEFCDGGTLEDILQRKHHLSEADSIKIFKQIINAFKAIYKENILHRDLKPSNILFHNDVIKIADFGFCKKMSSSNELTFTMVGSPIYMAPEILKGYPYNIKADIWSLGVVFYEMLFGVCPFEDKTLSGLIQRIDNQALIMHKEINCISSSTEGLLRKMLTLDYKNRIDWEELLNHSLFGEESDKSSTTSTTTIDETKSTISNGTNSGNVTTINTNDVKNITTNGNNYNTTTTTNNGNTTTNPSTNGNVKIDTNSVNNYNDELQSTVYHKEVIIRTLMKERNKIVFVSNLLHAILELNIVQKSSIVGFLLLKKINYMIDTLKKELSIENLSSKFKSLEKWEDFRVSDEYLSFSRYLNEEAEEAGSFLSAFKQEIQPILDTITDSSLKNELTKDVPELKFFVGLMIGYTEDIIKIASEKFKNKEEMNGTQLLIHTNEILDCINLEEFFEKTLIDNFLRLADQNYFSVIKKFNREKLENLINGKLNAAKKKLI